MVFIAILGFDQTDIFELNVWAGERFGEKIFFSAENDRSRWRLKAGIRRQECLQFPTPRTCQSGGTLIMNIL